MEGFYYDLHVHSCLSPCADDDMTPANIAGMASVSSLDIVALTDHNSTKNCPAFFRAAEKFGVVPIAGMELTTSEEIHVICLFKTLDSAMEFGERVDEQRIPVKNKKKIFGAQLIMDENDEIIGEEENLLINATNLTLDGAFDLVELFGGVCYPAHIDRESAGIVAVLGAFPDNPPYRAFELHDGEKLSEYKLRFPNLEKCRYVVSSDAHNLWSMSEGENKLELQLADGFTDDDVRCALVEYLKGEAYG